MVGVHKAVVEAVAEDEEAEVEDGTIWAEGEPMLPRKSSLHHVGKGGNFSRTRSIFIPSDQKKSG